MFPDDASPPASASPAADREHGNTASIADLHKTPQPSATSSASFRKTEASEKKHSGLASSVIKYAVTIGVLAYLILSKKINPSGIRLAPGGAVWVAAAALTLWAIQFMALFRFSLMLRGADIRLPPGLALRLAMIGNYFNLVAPGGIGGDVVRTGYVMAASRRRGAALAAAFVDRYVGLLGLALVGSAAVLWRWPTVSAVAELRVVAFLLWGLAGGMLLALAAAAVLGERAQALLSRASWPGSGILSRMAAAFFAYRRDGWAVAGGVAISVLFHIVLACVFFALGRGLTALSSPLSASQAAVATPLTFLANTLPMPGGGLGVGEAVFDRLLAWFPGEGGESITGGAMLFLAYRLLMLPFNLAGLPFYWRGRDIVEAGRAAYAEN